MTYDLDLTRLGPFREVDRYLLGFEVGVGLHYGLGVVYENKSPRRDRVHVFHSPGLDRGGGMLNFVEGIATQIRRRDDRAIALLTAWPTDFDSGASPERLIRHVMAPNDGSVRGGLFTVDEDDGFTNLVPASVQLYAASSFAPRPRTDELEAELGTPVVRFSSAEWEVAADQVDPDRSIRDEIDRRNEDLWGNHKAILQEWDVWGEDDDAG